MALKILRLVFSLLPAPTLFRSLGFKQSHAWWQNPITSISSFTFAFGLLDLHAVHFLAVCFLHQTRPVKLRGALTGVCLGAKNEEEMNYAAPSHSPADSISAESQPHGRACERSAHKYLPPHTPYPTPQVLSQPSHHPKGGLSDGDGERMSLSAWLSAAGPGPGHIPALWARVGGLPLSAGPKGLARSRPRLAFCLCDTTTPSWSNGRSSYRPRRHQKKALPNMFWFPSRTERLSAPVRFYIGLPVQFGWEWC